MRGPKSLGQVILVQANASKDQERRLNAIRAFLADQYSEDVEVKFKQVELHNKLLDLFVDLPFQILMRAEYSAVSNIAASLPFRIHVAESNAGVVTLAPTDEDEKNHTASLLLAEFDETSLNQIVVEGGPGQGKSTLAQYLCQVHRIRLLEREDDLGKLPSHHMQTSIRLPFKVDIRDLSTWIGGADPFSESSEATVKAEHRTLETFLARLVRHHCGGIDFDVHDAIEIAKLVPLLIVLDGLDEVADIRRRSDVVSVVSKSIPRLRENCPDLRVVITSRPAAFANSPGFDIAHFPHLELGYVTRNQLEKYATKWMDVRNLSRKERAEFQSILNEKMEAPHLRDLARNPMQLAILLSLIHTRGAALPDKRTSLYDAYVELFFSREAAKNPYVRQHIDLLKDIHRYLAWVLHSTAETTRRKAGGRISAQELRETLEAYLRSEKHSTAVLDEVFGAMLERVVMIVSRVQGTYEFEVQPLREYFAARYLYDTASYSPPGKEHAGTKPDRFDAIARNFYWLNVVRFFCGCFSKGELLDLADRVKDLMFDPILGKTRHPTILASILLADWVFSQSPKAVTDLAETLSTRESLRKLAADRLGHRSEVTRIPPQCGGTEVVTSAWNVLEEPQTRRDLALRLAELINANSSQTEVDAHWLSAARLSLARDPNRWLYIGYLVEALMRAEKKDVLSVLGDQPLNDRTAMLLLQAGRSDCVFTSDSQSAALIKCLFWKPTPNLLAQTYQSPLFLLPAFLYTGQFSSSMGWPIGYQSFHRTYLQFKEMHDAGRQIEFPFTSDLSRKAYEFSRRLLDTNLI
jgi:hypothetical protein